MPSAAHPASSRPDAVPRVSAIVIFFEAANYLDEAIASIEAQTFADWELLLVDDGSTDGSRAIADRWAARAPQRIRVLEHDGRVNLGMSATRNLGLAAARGEWIAFLDADDVWLPQKLEQQLDVLERHPAAEMVIGPTLFWYGWTGRDEDRARDHVGRLGAEPERVLDPPLLLALALESDGATLPGMGSLMLRRSTVLRACTFDPSFRGCYEDQVFLAKAFLHARVVLTDRCTDRYRQHAESCCARAIGTGEYHPDRPHPARERYLTWLERYLAEQHVTEERLWRALRRCLEPYRRPLRWRLRVHAVNAAVRGRRIARKTARLLAGRAGAAAWRRATAAVAEADVWLRGSLGAGNGPGVATHYLRRFLVDHAAALRGRVLLVGAEPGHLPLDPAARVEVVPALASAGAAGGNGAAPAGTFDCVVATCDAAPGFAEPLATQLQRLLAPRGTGLVAVRVAAASQPAAAVDEAQEALRAAFPIGLVTVSVRGNAWSLAASRRGLPAGRLPASRLDAVDTRHPVLLCARVQQPDEAYLRQMTGRWEHLPGDPSRFGDERTYPLALGWLDGHGVVEDWGCGRGHARRFLTRSPYVGVDGSATRWAQKVVDLRSYRTSVDCILLRHVLEHNVEWQRVLDNALASFRRRMVLVLFTPWAEHTTELARWSGIPDLSLCRADVVARFPPGVRWREESLATSSQYGIEHVFYFER